MDVDDDLDQLKPGHSSTASHQVVSTNFLLVLRHSNPISMNIDMTITGPVYRPQHIRRRMSVDRGRSI